VEIAVSTPAADMHDEQARALQRVDRPLNRPTGCLQFGRHPADAEPASPVEIEIGVVKDQRHQS